MAKVPAFPVQLFLPGARKNRYIQSNAYNFLGQLEKWAHGNLMQFNETKYKFLHLGWVSISTSQG